MNIFAISDLHLPGGDTKPMDVFGAHWERHFEQIGEDWWARVGENDVVLLPGDLSWAMQLADAIPDLRAIGELPGRKIILRGNHDYWWSSLTQVRAALPQGMYALQNDAIVLDGQVFCGTRGWNCPGDAPQTPEDAKIYAREVLRLTMSLAAAHRLAPDVPPVVLMHYPPCNEKCDPSGFLEALKAQPVAAVVYGHLHGPGLRHAVEGERDGIRMFQVSCDHLQFKLLRLDLT